MENIHLGAFATGAEVKQCAISRYQEHRFGRMGTKYDDDGLVELGPDEWDENKGAPVPGFY